MQISSHWIPPLKIIVHRATLKLTDGIERNYMCMSVNTFKRNLILQYPHSFKAKFRVLVTVRLENLDSGCRKVHQGWGWKWICGNHFLCLVRINKRQTISSRFNWYTFYIGVFSTAKKNFERACELQRLERNNPSSLVDDCSAIGPELVFSAKAEIPKLRAQFSWHNFRYKGLAWNIVKCNVTGITILDFKNDTEL